MASPNNATEKAKVILRLRFNQTLPTVRSWEKTRQTLSVQFLGLRYMEKSSEQEQNAVYGIYRKIITWL